MTGQVQRGCICKHLLRSDAKDLNSSKTKHKLNLIFDWKFISGVGPVIIDYKRESLVIALGHVLVRMRIDSLQWRHYGYDSVSNHQRHDCLLNRLFTQIKKIKAPRHWPLYGEFTGTGEFPAQMASNADNVSIWWRHHVSNMSYNFCWTHLTEWLIGPWVALHGAMDTIDLQIAAQIWKNSKKNFRVMNPWLPIKNTVIHERNNKPSY